MPSIRAGLINLTTREWAESQVCQNSKVHIIGNFDKEARNQNTLRSSLGTIIWLISKGFLPKKPSYVDLKKTAY